MVQPSSQLLGSGFGHSGSTTKRGACTVAPCASALFCSSAWPTARPAMPAASRAPDTNAFPVSLTIRLLHRGGIVSIKDRVPLAVGSIIGERIGLVRALQARLT